MCTCKFEISAFYSPDNNGIIEVPRRFAVDSDYWKIAKVPASFNFWFWNCGINAPRFVHDFRRKAMRQMKFADDDFDIDSEVVLVTQNLNHSAPRILCSRRPVGDCDIHHYTFEVVPFGAAGRLVAEDTVNRLSFLLPRARRPRDSRRDAGATRDAATLFFRVLHPWRD